MGTNKTIRTIAINLIRIRVMRSLSQIEVSKILDISQSSYNRMEQGLVHVRLDRLSRLAVFYDVLIDDFFRDDKVFSDGICALREKIIHLEEKIIHMEMHISIAKRLNMELEEKLGHQ